MEGRERLQKAATTEIEAKGIASHIRVEIMQNDFLEKWFNSFLCKIEN